MEEEENNTNDDDGDNLPLFVGAGVGALLLSAVAMFAIMKKASAGYNKTEERSSDISVISHPNALGNFVHAPNPLWNKKESSGSDSSLDKYGEAKLDRYADADGSDVVLPKDRFRSSMKQKKQFVEWTFQENI